MENTVYKRKCIDISERKTLIIIKKLNDIHGNKAIKNSKDRIASKY